MILLDLAKKYPDNGIIWTNLGSSLDNCGHIDAAIRYLKRAIEVDSSAFLPHLLLGNIYKRMGNLDKAYEEWKLSTIKTSEIHFGHLHIAEYLFFKGHIDECLKYLDMYNKAFPKSSSGYWIKALIYLMNKRTQEGEYLLRTAEALESDPLFVKFMYGYTYIMLKDFDKGRAFLQEYIDATTEYNLKFCEAVLLLSDSYLSEDNLQKGMEVLEKAAEKHESQKWPFFKHYYFNLIQIYKSMPYPPVGKVIQQYRKLLPSENKNIEFILEMSEFMLYNGAEKEALYPLEYALKNFPEDSRVFFLLGQTLLLCRQIDDAFKYLKRSLELNPNSPHAHCLMGIAYKEMGQTDLALSHVTEALSLDPKFVNARIEMISLKAMNQSEDLYEYVDKVFEDVKGRPSVCESIANVLLNYPEHTDFVCKLLTTFLTIHPNVKSIQALLVDVYHEQKRFDDARTIIMEMVVDEPKNPRGYNLLGRHYRLRGEYDAAIKQVYNAIDIDPLFVPSYIALIECYMLKKEYQKVLGVFNKVSQIFKGSWVSVLYKGAFVIGRLKDVSPIMLDTPDEYIDLQAGVQLLEEALKLKCPMEASINKLLYEVYLLLNDGIKAAYYLNQYTVLSPPSRETGDRVIVTKDAQ